MFLLHRQIANQGMLGVVEGGLHLCQPQSVINKLYHHSRSAHKSCTAKIFYVTVVQDHQCWEVMTLHAECFRKVIRRFCV